jgi:hypothetical protein
VVNEWRVVKEPLVTVEAIASTEEQATVDNGKVAQAEAVAEDVDVGTAQVLK